MLRHVLTLALFLVCVGCLSASAQDGSPVRSEEIGLETPGRMQPEDPTASERLVEQQLTQILEDTGWFQDVSVTLRHGVITIDGMSNTAENRAWAGTLAERLDGTLAVVNRLDVGSDFATALDRTGAEFDRLGRRAEQIFPLAVFAIGIAVATWLVSALVARLARRALAPRIASPLLLSVVVRLISIPFLLLGIYFVLQVAGLTRLAVTVLGGTGIFGIIVGFAFRDIAENFLASLLLSVRNPFKSGDLIEVAGHTGIVQNLNTRSTVLLTLEGNHVQIPNAAVFKSTITNYSSTPTRRAEFLVNIGSEDSIAQAQARLLAILNDHPAVLARPEPLVLVDNLGATTIALRVSYWYDGRTYSPSKTNSALLRLTRNALLRPLNKLPTAALLDTAKITSVSQDNEGVSPLLSPRHKGAADNEEMTMGEGELTNESDEVERQSEGEIPEAAENLLNR